MLVKGDRFVAEGYLHTFQSSNDEGLPVHREEFVARKIGHDMAYTTYGVDRTPKIQQGPTNGCTVPPPPTAGEPVAVGL